MISMATTYISSVSESVSYMITLSLASLPTSKNLWCESRGGRGHSLKTSNVTSAVLIPTHFFFQISLSLSPIDPVFCFAVTE